MNFEPYSDDEAVRSYEAVKLTWSNIGILCYVSIYFNIAPHRFSPSFPMNSRCTNLLIRDLRIVDGIEKATGVDLDKTNATNIKPYVQFSMAHARFAFAGMWKKTLIQNNVLQIIKNMMH